MRKRKAALLLATCLLLAAASFGLLNRSSEPHYHGRSLSSWLDASAYEPTMERQHQATQAIRQIGTNALPHLLQYIKYRPPAWKTITTTAFTKLRAFPLAGRLIPDPLTTDRAAVQAESAVYAFVAFG